jgi:hypothetical protein
MGTSHQGITNSKKASSAKRVEKDWKNEIKYSRLPLIPLSTEDVKI